MAPGERKRLLPCLTDDAAFNARIDRLTERHEALTQSAELLVADSRLHAERLDGDKPPKSDGEQRFTGGWLGSATALFLVLANDA